MFHTGSSQYNALPQKGPGAFLPGKNFFCDLDSSLAFCHLCRLWLFGFFALPPPQQHQPPQYCQYIITHLTTSVNPHTLSFPHIHSLSYTEFSTIHYSFPQVFPQFCYSFPQANSLSICITVVVHCVFTDLHLRPVENYHCQGALCHL